jgi:hypothetical protein
MRNIYFVLFGLVLIILILLVDWHESWLSFKNLINGDRDNAIAGQQPEEKPLGQMEPPEESVAAFSSTPLDSLPDEPLPDEFNDTSSAAGVSAAELENALALPGELARLASRCHA